MVKAVRSVEKSARSGLDVDFESAESSELSAGNDFGVPLPLLNNAQQQQINVLSALSSSDNILNSPKYSVDLKEKKHHHHDDSAIGGVKVQLRNPGNPLGDTKKTHTKVSTIIDSRGIAATGRPLPGIVSSQS